MQTVAYGQFDVSLQGMAWHWPWAHTWFAGQTGTQAAPVLLPPAALPAVVFELPPGAWLQAQSSIREKAQKRMGGLSAGRSALYN
ncbi:MAG TPA: hypothetical protein VMB50_11510 [Myxococcales bacterium]|nr:hypothetical protein [Myxococcales bacterium]